MQQYLTVLTTITSTLVQQIQVEKICLAARIGQANFKYAFI